MKKRIMLVALMFVFSVQFLHAQRGGGCPIDDVCDPTPTPTPIPTPTPTPTPTPGAVGLIGPKYVVLSVTYAPPGSSSTVTYSNSTLFGSSLSLNSSLTNAASVSTTLTNSANIFGTGFFNGSTFSAGFTQEADTSASIAVTESATETFVVRGPSSSAVGISHDEDIIWLWLNPAFNFHMPSSNIIDWDSVGFDDRDPAGDLDIFPVQVKYLNGHAAIPSNIADVLARRWAPRILCATTDPECQPDGTKDPGLTAADFAAILGADPFTNPAYLIDVPTASNCTTDGRYCLAVNHSFQYSPPPPGGQPITQTFSETRTATATQGIGASVSFQVGFSDQFGTSTQALVTDFLQTLKIADTLTLTDKINLLNNQQASQTSSFSITGPAAADNYTGPVELNVFQDNVYGTFMFGAIPQPTFNLFVSSPASQSVSVGNCVDYTVNVGALVSGFNSNVNLSVSAGLPQGVTVTFNPSSVTGAGSSNMHVCAALSAPLTNNTLTIRGVVGIEAHTATAGLAVTDFTLGATPSSQSIVVGGTASYTVPVAALNGFTGAVNLSVVSGLPAGATPTFTPASITGSGSSALSIATSTTTPLGTYTICIAGVSGSLSHSACVTLTVSSAPAGDFSLSASPGSQTLNAGDSASYTISSTALNGFTGTVSLTASGPGGDVFVDLFPASISGNGAATLSVSTDSNTAAGTYFITITGVSGSLNHSASVTLTVNTPPGGCDPFCPIQ